jgi:hypothetical protein
MGFVREFSLPKQLEFHPQAISENNSLLYIAWKTCSSRLPRKITDWWYEDISCCQSVPFDKSPVTAGLGL